MPEVAEPEVQKKAPPIWELGALARPQDTPATTSEPESKVETPPTEEKAVEERREMLEKVPEKPMSPKGQENFAKVRESLKQKETELAERDNRIKEFEAKEAARLTEIEADKTRIRELESKLATVNPDEMTAREQKYQEELNSLRGELKLVALERDPEFISRFDKPKEHLQSTLQELATVVQVDPNDFQRALRLGQEDKLDEIREALPTHLQRKWDAAMLNIEQVNIQRDMALKDKESTYNEITQRRQSEYQSRISAQSQQQIALARQLAHEPFEKIDALKGNDELRGRIERELVALAGGEDRDKYTPEVIFREVAASHVQRWVLQNQNAIIEDYKSKTADLEAKLKEREDFIQKSHGSLPTNDSSSTEKKEASKPRPIWDVAHDVARGKRDDFI